MSSGSDLVQRRGRTVQEAGQPVTHEQQSVAAGGLKTWHLWMLFGLGWPSVLLFFLSLIPTFSAKTQGLLLTFGWLFCACWWISAASGLLSEKQTSKQALAFKANLIMAGIGSAVGGVLTASYAYYNWPWLYIAAFAVAVGAGVALRSMDDTSGSKAAADTSAATAGTGDGRTAAAEHQE